MITEALINYLKDQKVSLGKKRIYLETLNLQYSDLFKLKEIFRYDAKLYQILHGLTYYRDSGFDNKIGYKNRKIKSGAKQKRIKKIRRKNYDKHKRK